MTTPPVPSETTRSTRGPGATVAEDESSDPRRMAIASISSMKPIAPPSARAARRSARKYERILRAVAP